MIDFTYDVIERSRRRMLYEAILLGRNYSNDDEIRQYLLNYLQEGLGAEKIAQLAEQPSINFDEWLALFSKISTPIEAGEIRGISIRLLETYPDHPGMLLLRGISETLIQKRDDLLVRNSITTSLENAKSRYDCANEQLNELLEQLIDFANSRSPNFRIPLISAIRHAGKNIGFIDKSVTTKLVEVSNTWDDASRVMVSASELEVKIPHLMHLANQRLERHMNYLKEGRNNV
jgi:ATP-dependent DNA helicase RecQ